MHHTIIQKDLYRAYGKWLNPLQILGCFVHPNLHYLIILRICQKFPKTSILGVLGRIMLRRYQIKYGF